MWHCLYRSVRLKGPTRRGIDPRDKPEDDTLWKWARASPPCVPGRAQVSERPSRDLSRQGRGRPCAQAPFWERPRTRQPPLRPRIEADQVAATTQGGPDAKPQFILFSNRTVRPPCAAVGCPMPASSYG
jgi:hypothetical protein